MALRLLSTLAIAAATLSVTPAHAAGPSGYDDVTYPAQGASFTTVLDGEAIVTPDVTYPGPHTAFAEPLSSGARGALAVDDTAYPVVDEVPAAPVPAPEQRLACSCGAGR